MTGSMAGQAGQRHRLVGWRRWAARGVLMVLAPTLVLLVIELGLRVAGYGHPTSFFMPSADGQHLLLNEKFSWQFAPKAIAPDAHPMRFAARKKPGTFRIFILGESAAMGTPEPAFAFGRILRQILREAYPGAEFEVINCGMTAIGSHIVLPIAEEAAKQEGDLYIIYTGNNEMTGPFGPATVFKQYTASRALIRASIWTKRTRTGQCIVSLLGGHKSEIKEWKGLANSAAYRVAYDDPRCDKVHAHFQANLDAMLRAVTRRAPAIVCTMGVNLKDCPPFASLHRRGLDEARKAEWERHYAAGVAAEEKRDHAGALVHYRQAMEIDGEYAELRYRMGQCHFALGESAAAREQYIAARDLDALQFRTDSRSQAIIRQAAGALAGRGVKLADVEAAFAASPLAEQGVPGKALLWEHVHMTFEGNHLIARTLLPLVAEALPEEVRRSTKGVPPDAQRMAELLCYTPFEHARCANSIQGMMARPPFTGQVGHAQRLAEVAAEAGRVDLSPRALERSIALYDAAIGRDPEDWNLRYRYAMFLGETGRAGSAREQIDAVARILPSRHQKLREARARLFLREGKADEAIAAYEELIRSAGDSPQYRLDMGLALLLGNKPGEAEQQLREALRMKPTMTAAMDALGSALLGRGDVAGAEAEYRRALAVMDDPHVHVNLAVVLKRQGKAAEAIGHLKRAAELNPHWAAPRFRLATALLEAKDPKGAYFELKAVVALDPRHGQAHALLAQLLLPRDRPPTEEVLNHMRGAYEAGGASPDLLAAYAWFLATHPDPFLRDGALALKVAQEACQRTQNESIAALRSLAAAYAERERFEEAVATAQQARELAMKANQAAMASALADNISAYRRKQTVYQRR